MVSFSVTVNTQVCYFAAVYGAVNYVIRRTLWAHLIRLQEAFPSPWQFLGDFNAILGAHEKKGGCLPIAQSCQDFIDWTQAGDLTHINTRGSNFTWSNGRLDNNHIQVRLDRTVCNQQSIGFWDAISCSTLSKCHSDHYPILLVLAKGAPARARPFRFLSVWLEHPDCRRLVTETWKEPVVGCPMFILKSKLKRVKLALRSWNWEVFGNIHEGVRSSWQSLDSIQREIHENGRTD